MQFPVISFRLGSQYDVKTVNHQGLYFGRTTTTYEKKDGSHGSFDSNSVIYQVQMTDPDKTSAKYSVVIYNAKFAEEQPNALAEIKLEGMNMEWRRGSYVLTGENIVPKVREGDNTVDYTPYDRYTFDNITMTVTGNDLETARVDYSVAGKYKGSFTGTMIQKYQDHN